jgi:multidrug transporter EmrE-like cation transporter
MQLITISAILTSVLLSVLAQIFLKFGMSRLVIPAEWFSWSFISVVINKYVILGLTCYGLSMVFWLYVLTRVDVSRAYPFVGLGFIGTMLFAHFFLQEPITIQKLTGTLLIVAGVVLLAR